MSKNVQMALVDIGCIIALTLVLNAIWCGFELLFDGGIQTSVSDTIIGGFFVGYFWAKSKMRTTIRNSLNKPS